MNNVEDVLVFYSKPPTYNPQMTEGTPYRILCKTKGSELYGKQEETLFENNGTRHPLRTIELKSRSNSFDKPVHPTQKPVALFEYLIKTYTNEGDIVLDNCAGSFTTAIAALNTKRNYICMEKEQKYFEIGEKRITEWHTEKEQRLF